MYGELLLSMLTRWSSLKAAIAFSLALGVLMVLLVPPGLPYDEPSHFAVASYAAHGFFLLDLRLPGLPYEAYQPPLYYLFGGAILKLFSAWPPIVGLYALRIFGLLLYVPFLVLSERFLRRYFNRQPKLQSLVLWSLALNPVLLAIAASVQNDLLAIVLCMWAYDYYSSLDVPSASPRQIIRLGLLIAFALLTKLTTIFVFPVLFFSLWSQHRKRLRFPLLLVAVVMGVSGWWFLRNGVLYHDITGARMVAHLFSGSKIQFPQSLPSILREIVTYHFSPVEYFRNIFKLSLLARGIVVVTVALAALGVVRALAQKSSDMRSLLAHEGLRLYVFGWLVSFGLYLFEGVVAWRLSYRMTFPLVIIPTLVLAYGLLNAQFRGKQLPLKVLLALLALNTAAQYSQIVISSREVASFSAPNWEKIFHAPTP